MGKLPNEIFGFMLENWDSLGMTPVFLFRLLERGFTQEEIDYALTEAIGKDYAEIKVSIWIDRLEAKGVIIPDEVPPLIDILYQVVFTLVHQRDMIQC